jgi:hypothetical protein
MMTDIDDFIPSNNWVLNARVKIIDMLEFDTDEIINRIEQYINEDKYLSSDKLYAVRKVIHDAKQYHYRMWDYENGKWIDATKLIPVDLYLRLK